MEGCKGILENLRAMVSMKETKGALTLWMGGLGLGCALLSLCWAGGRLAYKGCRTSRGNKDAPRTTKPHEAPRKVHSNSRREPPGHGVDSGVNRTRTRQDEVGDNPKPRIMSKVEVIERLGLDPFRALDTLASLISQAVNPEARLATVVKTLELKTTILLKRKFPNTRIVEVEEREDDSEEESESSTSSIESSTSSISYGTDRGSGDEDKESEKSATRQNPQFEGETRPKRN